jgi:hypothetical protein
MIGVCRERSDCSFQDKVHSKLEWGKISLAVTQLRRISSRKLIADWADR